MEKFGVAERDDSGVKTGSENDAKCVKCGKALKDTDLTGGTKICPSCGTEPYEEK